MCNYKKAAHIYLTGQFLDGLDIKPDHKNKIREVTKSVEMCRKHVTPYSGALDLTWQVGWPESSKLTLTFIEDVVYTTFFDGRYKDAKKSGLEILDFFAYPSLQERIDEIKAAIASEKPAPAVTMAPSPSTTAGPTDSATEPN